MAYVVRAVIQCDAGKLLLGFDECPAERELGTYEAVWEARGRLEQDGWTTSGGDLCPEHSAALA